jgi:hypothetical protein
MAKLTKARLEGGIVRRRAHQTEATIGRHIFVIKAAHHFSWCFGSTKVAKRLRGITRGVGLTSSRCGRRLSSI